MLTLIVPLAWTLPDTDTVPLTWTDPDIVTVPTDTETPPAMLTVPLTAAVTEAPCLSATMRPTEEAAGMPEVAPTAVVLEASPPTSLTPW